MSEAFVYLWFDSKNRKFYLGKHKGTPYDGYTHSSTVMESFDVPPPHMKRRILAYGTDEEMCLLEHELLKIRKEKKWDRYYNKSIGAPWFDQSGENNHQYKHGLTNDPEWKKQSLKKWKEENRDKVREWYDEYYNKNKDKILKRVEEYNARHPDVPKKSRKKYYAKNKEKIRAQRKKLYEENIEKYRERGRKAMAKYRAKKKAEKLAQQTGATLPI